MINNESIAKKIEGINIPFMNIVRSNYYVDNSNGINRVVDSRTAYIRKNIKVRVLKTK